jgi:hypothetical protein
MEDGASIGASPRRLALLKSIIACILERPLHARRDAAKLPTESAIAGFRMAFATAPCGNVPIWMLKRFSGSSVRQPSTTTDQ